MEAGLLCLLLLLIASFFALHKQTNKLLAFGNECREIPRKLQFISNALINPSFSGLYVYYAPGRVRAIHFTVHDEITKIR